MKVTLITSILKFGESCVWLILSHLRCESCAVSQSRDLGQISQKPSLYLRIPDKAVSIEVSLPMEM